jgi:N-acylneuraminate cytidylyltransferase
LIGIIPARGGSKGIKLKNLSMVGNRSLMEIGVKKLFESGCEKVIVSSDNELILEKAESYGATRHFRADVLSSDDATTYSLISHLIDAKVVAEHDLLIIHQVTAPFLKKESIKIGIDRLISSEGMLKSIFSVFCGNHVMWIENKDGSWELSVPEAIRLPRQKRPQTATETGGMYLAFARDIRAQNKLLPSPTGTVSLTYIESMDIDTQNDLDQANLLFKFI